MPYMHTYKVNDKYHIYSWATKLMDCGVKGVEGMEDRIMGSIATQPDPKKEELCPICWKFLPMFKGS